MKSTVVISLGGSLIAPDRVDDRFLKAFYLLLRGRLERETEQRFILVTGGGAPCREYQRSFRAVSDVETNSAGADDLAKANDADWIGIAATKLNAELVRRVFARHCHDPVVSDPEGGFNFTGRVLVASGWKPGRSTDYVAVALAKKYKADKVINLTNVAQVYSADPRHNPAARPFADIGWKDYRAIVGDEWTPGRNAPFDPVASRLAQEAGVTVVIVKGSNREEDLENLKLALDGKEFFGTTIHP
jgi:uridylate kinase